MTSSLENLFKQIIDSEDAAQKRKAAITKLKAEHSQVLEKIYALQEQQQYHKRQEAVKTHQLNDSQLQVQCLSSKIEILLEQKKEQEECSTQLQKKLKALADDRIKERETFCTEVKSFGSQFDLEGQGETKRENKAKQEMEELTKQEELLLKDLDELKQHRNEVEKLRNEKEEKQKELKMKQLLLSQRENEFKNEQEKTKKLEDEKNEIFNMPYHDPEFKKLQEELEEFKNDPIKEECRLLQLELKELQQAKWQKELKRKRELQQNQRLAFKLARQRREKEQAASAAPQAVTIAPQAVTISSSAAIQNRAISPRWTTASALVAATSSGAPPAAAKQLESGSAAPPAGTAAAQAISSAPSAVSVATASVAPNTAAYSNDGKTKPSPGSNFRKFSNFTLRPEPNETTGQQSTTSSKPNLNQRSNSQGYSQANSQGNTQGNSQANSQANSHAYLYGNSQGFSQGNVKNNSQQ